MELDPGVSAHNGIATVLQNHNREGPELTKEPTRGKKWLAQILQLNNTAKVSICEPNCNFLHVDGLSQK